MPLTLPELDDRRFEDLVAEARALIPALAPDWTNHNPSDPGITLVELFAWLTELLMYRLNRVTDDNVRSFLRLLNGPGWTASADLQADVRQTVLQLRHCDRAVVPADFEALALAADPRVARAHCIARRNLAVSPDADAPGHVSVVILAASGVSPPADLLAAVAAYLDPRRMLTTRVHVVPPRFVPVGVAMTLNLAGDAVAATVRAQATARLAGFLDPLRGGADGAGWPFGRPVYLSEIVRLLDTVPGVDHVTANGARTELVTGNPAQLVRNSDGGLVSLTLAPDQLVQAAIDPMALALQAPPHA
jgi:hypothetical protein